ncbi:MAG: hypothetical protein QG608_1909 [Actinomycetota bacterium]|nr:hypothetical protein [Actinomycetota bacterium]
MNTVVALEDLPAGIVVVTDPSRQGQMPCNDDNPY